MVGIERISGIRQPADTKRADGRSREVETLDAIALDDVQISPEAQRAAEAARLLEQNDSQNEMLAERIAEAQANLEKGTYKVQSVVLQVAARISRYVQLSSE